MKWLDRDTVYAPYMTLCLTEAQYLRAVKHCKVQNPSPWLSPNHKACLHTWEMEGKGHLCGLSQSRRARG